MLYKVFTFITAACLIMTGVGCAGEKENKMNLENWLEKNDPGKYVVINNIVDLDLKNLYHKKKQTIIGLKEDPVVQMKVEWVKNETEPGLDAVKIGEEMEAAQHDMEVARQLSKQLKEIGLEKIAVGAMRPALYFLPFGEPTPEARGKQLSGIFSLLQKEEFPTYTSIWIEYMEDSIHQKEFIDVIPNGYWYRGDSYHERHKIMSHNFEWKPDLEVKTLTDGWAFNSGSDRSFVFMEKAFPIASEWAERHLAKPYYLSSHQFVELKADEEDPLFIHYSFPHFASEISPDSLDAIEQIKGYVTGRFHADHRTFTDIRERKVE